MARLGLESDIVDRDVYDRSLACFRDAAITLPTFEQLADPNSIPAAIDDTLARVNPDEAHPANLFRVHWHNDSTRAARADVPEHLVLPPELTGVRATIALALGNRFPMIRAHKVLAAYGCLAPRIVTGQFDPTSHKALWPSTGNYCRGGVAISRILGCRGVAILPEEMSDERFEWLSHWTQDPSDIVRTPGSESNVKEIYDECTAQDRDPQNVVFNQFCEFGNHLVHWLCTGRALERVFQAMQRDRGELNLSAFVSATGSAGTLAAGDYLADRFGSRTVATEAAECPTMLCNGFGAHNIQGIGDKHIPLIHNVMRTDFAVAVSDRSTDALHVLFNSEVGRRHLTEQRGVSPDVVAQLSSLGLSSIANMLSAIKMARHLDLGPEDVVLTVATDGAEMYTSELAKITARQFSAGFDEPAASAVFSEHILGADTELLLELDERERTRVFNLGYFTWVEQQGLSLEDFEARRQQDFWVGLRELIPAWDEMIREFNARTGAASSS